MRVRGARARAARTRSRTSCWAARSTLYWVLVVAVLAYAASYFARGFLAGHHRFELYGGLVFMEATSRLMFALAVTVGIASGQAAVALGIAAAPLVSLVGGARWRWAARTSPSRRDTGPADDEGEFTLSKGAGFAVAVLLIMLAEQTFLNAGPLLVKATEGGAAGAALAGFTFNVLLIARAPLQLFQAIQTSILPHLTRLRAGGEDDPFRRSVYVTLMAIAGFAAAVALVMAAAGPALMDLVFGGDGSYERGGLVIIAVGMGLYLAAATLNQAALARGHTVAGRGVLGGIGAGLRRLPADGGDGRPRAAGRAGLHRRGGGARLGPVRAVPRGRTDGHPRPLERAARLGQRRLHLRGGGRPARRALGGGHAARPAAAGHRARRGPRRRHCPPGPRHDRGGRGPRRADRPTSTRPARSRSRRPRPPRAGRAGSTGRRPTPSPPAWCAGPTATTACGVFPGELEEGVFAARGEASAGRRGRCGRRWTAPASAPVANFGEGPPDRAGTAARGQVERLPSRRRGAGPLSLADRHRGPQARGSLGLGRPARAR